MCDLKGISQAALAKRCKPRTQQAAIEKFENAKACLTHSRARQLAPGYFEKLWHGNAEGREELAVNSVWKLWFANVEAHGSPEMKRRASVLKANWTAYPWEEPATGLFAGQAPAEMVTQKVGVTI